MVSPKKLWVCYVNKAALPAKTIKNSSFPFKGESCF